MKPVSVRFQCFGPYVQEQFIDFQELEKNGLFLICGETGAGKTTILDAICYALYGRSSGGLRGDLTVMRCKLAENHEETLVEFVFDSDGKRYKFIRSLKYGRKNLNDSHNCLVLTDGEYVPIFENPKATVVNKKAEELIGLTYEQFRQVIILPQGQFEKLLVSNSEEKEKILVSLFHAERWQCIAEEVYSRVSQRDKALHQEKDRISAKLMEYGCENLGALEEKREAACLRREELKNVSALVEKTVAEAKKQWEQALLNHQEFETLEKLRKDHTALLQKEAFFAEEEKVLQNADAAEAIRPRFAAWQEAAAQKLRADGNLKNSQSNLENARKELAKVLDREEVHKNGRPAFEENQQRLVVLENVRELYRTLAEKQRTLQDADRASNTARISLDMAQKQFSTLDAAWQKAVSRQETAIRAWQQAQEGYLQGIGSVLAGHLTEGQPCPVCGSREHPMPAQPSEGHISEAKLEELNQSMNAANDAASAALRQRTGAETARAEAEVAFHRASHTAAVAKVDYENAQARKIGGIDIETDLESEILRLRVAVEDYEQAEQRIVKDLAERQGNEKTAQTAHQTATEELAAAEAAHASKLELWQAALAGSGLETEERFRAADMDPKQRQKRTAELLRFQGDLSRAAKALTAQKTLLEGKSAPDMVRMRTELDAAEKQGKEAASQLALAEDHLRVMDSDIRELRKRTVQYETDREKVDADMDFANRLRGRSGVSLQRYVLGVMLTSVTVEANRLLSNVYGGRYRLYRTDQIAGSARKGGLELEVFDSQNDQRRSVTTLSGGEKFLVALSLAIGLSTVVQAQGGGIRLEAMFIDEGFGSLDHEAVNDALEVLQGIQKTAGTVGIISHVEALAESIPAKIEIQKGNRGSRCVIRG